MSHYTEAQRALYYPKAGGVYVTAWQSARDEWEVGPMTVWHFADGSVLTMTDLGPEGEDWDHYPSIAAFDASCEKTATFTGMDGEFACYSGVQL